MNTRTQPRSTPRQSFAVCLLAAAALPAAAAPFAGGDAAQGREMHAAHCVECHAKRFGGEDGSGVARVETPDTSPDHVVDLPTRPEQALLYRLNGDLNPLHSDPARARKLGFEMPILHGLCTMGVVTHALLSALAGYDPRALRAVSLRFQNPVWPGETIRTEIWNDGRFRARVPERDAIVIDGGLARVSHPARRGEQND